MKIRYAANANAQINVVRFQKEKLETSHGTSRNLQENPEDSKVCTSNAASKAQKITGSAFEVKNDQINCLDMLLLNVSLTNKRSRRAIFTRAEKIAFNFLAESFNRL